MKLSGFISAAMVMIIFSPSLQSFPPAVAIRSSSSSSNFDSDIRFSFRKSSVFQNGRECVNWNKNKTVCDPSLVHIAITLDIEYLRGSIAAVHSILQHSFCPENIFFHFLVDKNSQKLKP